MADKHTPGPWKIGTPPPNGEQTVGTDQGLMVAVATTGAGVKTKANAHLIAAAPDLYAALVHAQQNMPHPDQMSDEALAKARGQA